MSDTHLERASAQIIQAPAYAAGPVVDPISRAAAIIDSLMGCDAASGWMSFLSADNIIEFVTSNIMKVLWLMKAHAQHLSAAPYLQDNLGGTVLWSGDRRVWRNAVGEIF